MLTEWLYTSAITNRRHLKVLVTSYQEASVFVSVKDAVRLRDRQTDQLCRRRGWESGVYSDAVFAYEWMWSSRPRPRSIATPSTNSPVHNKYTCFSTLVTPLSYALQLHTGSVSPRPIYTRLLAVTSSDPYIQDGVLKNYMFHYTAVFLIFDVDS